MAGEAFDGILLMRPHFQPTIWGGRRLADDWGYDIPDGPVGECWAISAHPTGESHVEGGPFDGLPLSRLWSDYHDELFAGAAGDRFPLLVKIIDAAAVLSVQVHPDDAYAAAHEDGSLGKRECWLVLDAEPGSEVVFGQRAKGPEQFRQMVEAGDWDGLLRKVPVEPGDFFQVEPGCVHALNAGIMVLETQQSSDITYRVYDYDRPQADGTLRELHLDKAIDVIDYDAEPEDVEPRPVAEGVEELVRTESYVVLRVRCEGALELETPWPFACASVIDGSGKAAGTPVARGSHFVIPSGRTTLPLEGDLDIVMSYVPNADEER